MVKAENMSSAFFVRSVTDFTTDRCRTARGSAGKDERSDVNSENTSPTKSSDIIPTISRDICALAHVPRTLTVSLPERRIRS